jgi:predicted PurR-regulated permease PerM
VLIVVALAALAVWALVQVKLLVIPVLIAIILAAAAAPLVRWLRRRGMNPMLTAWITLLGGILVLGGVITLIVFAVRDQWRELAVSASEGFEDLLEWLRTLPFLDQAQIDAAREAIVDFVTSAEFGTGALAGVSAAAEVVTGTLLMVVVLFFFLKDGDRIWAFFLRSFHGARLERGRRIGETSVKVLGGYVRGTAVIALVDAVAIGAGLAILQVPLALPLAVIVFLGAFIPLVGATIAGILAALVALVANGPIVALIVVAIVIAVNQLEGDLLQPVVMAQSLKLHPLVILIALTAGTILGGIVGAVLAVPIAAVGWAIIKVWEGPDPSLDERRPLRRRRKEATDATSQGEQLPRDSAGGTPVA